MPRYEFRAHVSVVTATSGEAAKLIDHILTNAREAGEPHGFSIELDEGSPDIIEED